MPEWDAVSDPELDRDACQSESDMDREADASVVGDLDEEPMLTLVVRDVLRVPLADCVTESDQSTLALSVTLRSSDVDAVRDGEAL